MDFTFDLGKPFKPFQQLMGVLPTASKDLIPLAYQVNISTFWNHVRCADTQSQDLMYDDNSPILDFYPVEFEQDLNGKKQDWEAIVKIPFIEESRLVKAMACKYAPHITAQVLICPQRESTVSHRKRCDGTAPEPP